MSCTRAVGLVMIAGVAAGMVLGGAENDGGPVAEQKPVALAVDGTVQTHAAGDGGPKALTFAPADAWGVLHLDVKGIMRDLGVAEAMESSRPQDVELRPQIRAAESLTIFLLPSEPLRYRTGLPRWGAIVHLTPEGPPLLSEWSESMEEFRLGNVTGHQSPGFVMALVGERTLAIAGDQTGLESVIEAGSTTEGKLQAGLSELLAGYSEGTVCGAFHLPGPLGELASESDLEGASPWAHGVRGGAFCLDIGGGLLFRSVVLLGSPEDARQLRGELTQVIEHVKPDLEAALAGMFGELAWPLLVGLEAVEARVDESRFIVELHMGAEVFAGGDDFVSAADVAAFFLLASPVLFRPAGAAMAPRRAPRPKQPRAEPQPGTAAPPEGTWDGFRGIQWGGSLAGRDDMVWVDEDETGMMIEYTRKDDSMSVGDAKLKRLSYFACEDRFCRVTADVDGDDGLRALRLALEADYGLGNAVRRELPDARRWYGSTLRGAPVLGYALERCSVPMELGVARDIDWQLTHRPLVRAYERDKKAGRRDPAAERARVERLVGEQGEASLQPVPAAPPQWESGTRRVAVMSPAGDHEEGITYYTNELGMEFVPVPPGEFTMGSSPRQSSNTRYQGPLHRVRITKGFYMGAHEVTQDQYKAVMGSAPSELPGARRPVEMVTWRDAVAFCTELSRREGVVYRLPTEAEWEYACRAGSTGVYFFAEGPREGVREVIDEYKRRRGESPGPTHDIGLMPPNAWGLYGMSWNVREWCQDRYGERYYWKSPVDDPTGPESGESQVLRGGSTDDVSRWASATREGYSPTVRRNYVGFRVVCTGDPHPRRDAGDAATRPRQPAVTTDGEQAAAASYTSDLGMAFVLIPASEYLTGSAVDKGHHVDDAHRYWKRKAP